MTLPERDKDLRYQKNRIRTRVKLFRDQLSPEHRTVWSLAIRDSLISLDVFQKAQTVMLYRAFHNEVDLDPLFDLCWKAGKRTAVPRVEGRDINAYLTCDLDNDFSLGYYGIMEPLPTCQRVPAGEIDLVVVPGSAFDHSGHRLGWGKGFYDRFLLSAGPSVRHVAVAYNFQLVDQLPANEQDVSMHMLVTERQVLTFHF